jgi:hypothetical protein
VRALSWAATLLGLAAAARLPAQRAAPADPSLPQVTLLYQNFPNPFPALGQDATCLSFDLAIAAEVQLDILDLRGSLVRRLVPGPGWGPVLGPGRYGRSDTGGAPCDPRLLWDGRADNGREVPAGVYVYKLQASGVTQFRRIVFRGRNS